MDNEIVKNISKEFWGTNPAGWTFGKEYTKGSKAFFDAIIEKRFSVECDWFDQIIDYKSLNGKKVLEIGCGAGYDAYMFCKYNASYTGIDITPENIALTKKHLGYYNYTPTVLHMDAEKMNFSKEFDYIFSFGVLHHTPHIEKALENIYQALKPGGMAQIIVYYKYSFYYMFDVVLLKWIIKGGFLKRSLAQQRSLIEYTTHEQLPLVHVYSAREMKHLLEKAGFSIERYHIRKLVQEDLPLIRKLPSFNRVLKSMLFYLSKKWGWYLTMNVKKPQ